MRCAYLILAHRHPKQLARLVSALTSPQAALDEADTAFIHLDKRVGIGPYEDALKQAGLRHGLTHEFISERVTGAWGDFSLVQATLNLIRACAEKDNASGSGNRFHSVSLLSGQDYPLTGAAERKQRLAGIPEAEHLTCFTLPHQGWAMDGGLGRVRKYHNPGLRERIRTSGVPGARYLGAALAMALAQVPRAHEAPGGLRVYGGWQWWTLTLDCARYALRYAERHPEFVRFFQWSYIPDELFFQTLLMNSPYAERVTGNYLRFIEWDGVKPHVFELSDLVRLRAAAGTCLFARKFEPDGEKRELLLDALDEASGEERCLSTGARPVASGCTA